MTDFLCTQATGQERALLILAHGAGAPMDSPFMDRIAVLIAQQGITVVRFEFPYMAQRRTGGKKRPPERAPKLLEQWREVIAEVRARFQGEQGERPLYIGGKSMGGRMATLVACEGVKGVSGVVCLGYPFYAAGKADKPRIDHLRTIDLPVLVIQGERDAMGKREIVSGYALADSVDLVWLADGDHDLKPRKASGLSHQQQLEQAARAVGQRLVNGLKQ